MIIESLKPLEVDINSIKLDPQNARKHPEKNLNAIKKSLETYGQRKPIVVNKNTGFIEAGNGLFMAAKELGWDKIAAVFVDDAKEVAMAYGLMDNQSALISEWDLPTLKDLLTELDDGEVDMDVTGFTSKEIEDLMNQCFVPEEGLTDDDAIPENVETTCKKGDLWRLGEHRLLCGDSTVITDVERLMQVEKADMVFTDPPYGMNLDADFSDMKGIAGGNKYENVINDDKDYDPSFLLEYFKSCNEIILWGADYYAERILNRNNGSWFVWDKTGAGVSPNSSYEKMFGSNFELCWSKTKHKRQVIPVLWKGIFGLSQEDVRKRLHPTQKPVELCVWFIDKFSKQGNNIIDLFGGSGSTLIACEKLNRKCRMMEIDCHYNDVILERWAQFTGKDPIREDGKTWSQLKKNTND